MDKIFKAAALAANAARIPLAKMAVEETRMVRSYWPLFFCIGGKGGPSKLHPCGFWCLAAWSRLACRLPFAALKPQGFPVACKKMGLPESRAKQACRGCCIVLSRSAA